jgi:sterol desaturase/sphingolipid hydroxylase (fatty acid hydroxylase superfamily)
MHHNFGSTLAVWDRVFGTWLPGHDEDEARYGLAADEKSVHLLGFQVSALRRYWSPRAVPSVHEP